MQTPCACGAASGCPSEVSWALGRPGAGGRLSRARRGGAELEVGQLTKLNHDRSPEDLKEGQTILLPAGKLSGRDKAILAGIGSGKYRTYPVRKGEAIEDILDKRGIARAEADALNKDVNLSKLGGARAARRRPSPGSLWRWLAACRARGARRGAAHAPPHRRSSSGAGLSKLGGHGDVHPAACSLTRQRSPGPLVAQGRPAAVSPDAAPGPRAEGQLIKLPAGKYTVREREMLTGTAGAPSEYFMPGNPFSNSLIGGAARGPPDAHHWCGTLVRLV
jgi:hypothetical protein